MKVLVASEHAGYELKQKLISHLQTRSFEAHGFGAESTEPIDYPPIAADAAAIVAEGQYEFGIVICGTGLGVSIAAGKVPGIRAALCLNEYMAIMAREHNDANILALGSRVIGENLAYSIVDAFFKAGFNGERHARRVAQIADIEKRYSR